MPCFNSEMYVARAIESILNQTFSDFELIIIDDHSTDKSFVIAGRYAKLDDRIRLYRNYKNCQVASTLNRGVKLSRAPIIARMDADDYSYPDRLRLQYEILKRLTDVAIVGTDMEICDEKGIVISKREYPTRSGSMKKVMFRYSPFSHPTVMFRKKIFLEFGGYDLNRVPCEDIDLWFKIGSKYNFASIPKKMLKYTISMSSNSHKKLKKVELLGFKIKIDAIKKYGYRPSVYDVLYNLGQFMTFWFMPATLRIRMYDFFRSRGII